MPRLTLWSHKNIKLMLVFPKAAFMVIDISYQTTMTFLMMFSVILLYILEILLSAQSASGI